MSEQIRHCKCSPGCPVKYKYKKCSTCDEKNLVCATILQSNENHACYNTTDAERTMRGKYTCMYKKYLTNNY